MNSLNVKKGDNVIVLAGKDKGKKGTVIKAHPKTDDEAKALLTKLGMPVKT